MTQTSVRPAKPKMSQAARQENRWGLLFVAPPFVGFLIFMAFPIVFAKYVSYLLTASTANLILCSAA